MITLEHLLPTYKKNPETNKVFKLSKYTFDKVDLKINPEFDVIEIPKDIIEEYVTIVLAKAGIKKAYVNYVKQNIPSSDLGLVNYLSSIKVSGIPLNQPSKPKAAPALISQFIAILISVIFSNVRITKNVILARIKDYIRTDSSVEAEIFKRTLLGFNPDFFKEYEERLSFKVVFDLIVKVVGIRLTVITNQFILDSIFKEIDVRKLSGKFKPRRTLLLRYSSLLRKILREVGNDSVNSLVKTQLRNFINILLYKKESGPVLLGKTQKNITIYPDLGFYVLYPLQSTVTVTKIMNSPTILYLSKKVEESKDLDKNVDTENETISMLSNSTYTFVKLQSILERLATISKKRPFLTSKKTFLDNISLLNKEANALYKAISNTKDESIINFIKDKGEFNSKLLGDEKFLLSLFVFLFKLLYNKVKQANPELEKEFSKYHTFLSFPKILFSKDPTVLLQSFDKSKVVSEDTVYKDIFVPLVKHISFVIKITSSSKDYVLFALDRGNFFFKLYEFSKLFYTSSENLYSLLENISVLEEDILLGEDLGKNKEFIHSKVESILKFTKELVGFLKKYNEVLGKIEKDPRFSRIYYALINKGIISTHHSEFQSYIGLLDNINKEIAANITKASSFNLKEVEAKLNMLESEVSEFSVGVNKFLSSISRDKFTKKLSALPEILKDIRNFIRVVKKIINILNTISTASIHEILQTYSSSLESIPKLEKLYEVIKEFDALIVKTVEETSEVLESFVKLSKFLGEEDSNMLITKAASFSSEKEQIFDYGLNRADIQGSISRAFHEIRKGPAYILEPFYSMALYIILKEVLRIYNVKGPYVEDSHVRNFLLKDSAFYSIHKKNTEFYAKFILKEFGKIFESTEEDFFNDFRIRNILTLFGTKIIPGSKLNRYIEGIKRLILDEFNNYLHKYTSLYNSLSKKDLVRFSTYLVVSSPNTGDKKAVPVNVYVKKPISVIFELPRKHYELNTKDIIANLEELPGRFEKDKPSLEEVESLIYIRYLPFEALNFLSYLFEEVGIKSEVFRSSIPFAFIPKDLDVSSTKDLPVAGKLYSTFLAFVLRRSFFEKASGLNIEVLKALVDEFHKVLNFLSLSVSSNFISKLLQALEFNLVYFAEIKRMNPNVTFKDLFTKSSEIKLPTIQNDSFLKYGFKFEFNENDFKPVKSFVILKDINPSEIASKILDNLNFSVKEVAYSERGEFVEIPLPTGISYDKEVKVDFSAVSKNIVFPTEPSLKNSIVLALKFLSHYEKGFFPKTEIFSNLANICLFFIADSSPNKHVFKDKMLGYSLKEIIIAHLIEYLVGLLNSSNFSAATSFEELSSFDRALLRTYFGIPIVLYSSIDYVANTIYSEFLIDFIPKNRLNLLDLARNLYAEIKNHTDSIRVGTLEFTKKHDEMKDLFSESYLSFFKEAKKKDSETLPSFDMEDLFNKIGRNRLFSRMILFLALYMNLKRTYKDSEIEKFIKSITNFMQDIVLEAKNARNFMKALLSNYFIFVLSKLSNPSLEVVEEANLNSVSNFVDDFIKSFSFSGALDSILNVDKDTIDKVYKVLNGNSSIDSLDTREKKVMNILKQIQDFSLSFIEYVNQTASDISKMDYKRFVLNTLESIIKVSQPKEFNFMIALAALYFYISQIKNDKFNDLLSSKRLDRDLISELKKEELYAQNGFKEISEFLDIRQIILDSNLVYNKMPIRQYLEKENRFAKVLDFVESLGDEYTNYIVSFNRIALENSLDPVILQAILHNESLLKKLLTKEARLWFLCNVYFSPRKLKTSEIKSLLLLKNIPKLPDGTIDSNYYEKLRNTFKVLFKESTPNEVLYDIINPSNLNLLLYLKILHDKNLSILSKVRGYDSIRDSLKPRLEFLYSISMEFSKIFSFFSSENHIKEISVIFSNKEFLENVMKFYETLKAKISNESFYSEFLSVLVLMRNILSRSNKIYEVYRNPYLFFGRKFYKWIENISELPFYSIKKKLQELREEFFISASEGVDLHSKEDLDLEFYYQIGKLILSPTFEGILSKINLFFSTFSSFKLNTFLQIYVLSYLLNYVYSSLSGPIHNHFTSYKYVRKVGKVTSEDVHFITINAIKFFISKVSKVFPNLGSTSFLENTSTIESMKNYFTKLLAYISFSDLVTMSSEEDEAKFSLEKSLSPFKVALDQNTFMKFRREVEEFLAKGEFHSNPEAAYKSLLTRLFELANPGSTDKSLESLPLAALFAIKRQGKSFRLQDLYDNMYVSPGHSALKYNHIFPHLSNLVSGEYAKIGGFNFDFDNFKKAVEASKSSEEKHNFNRIRIHKTVLYFYEPQY